MALYPTPDDPNVDLEDVHGEIGIKFALAANKMCLSALGDPTTLDGDIYTRILESLESDDRIPFVSSMGQDENGRKIFFNLWKDSQHRRGLWRKTTMDSYESGNPDWTTVLDIDALSKKEGTRWIWRGSRVLPRSRDPSSLRGKKATLALVSLSTDDSDDVQMREFDLETCEFVTKDGFNLPAAKTRACYRSRDVLLVASDFGPGSLTKAGYPRTIREWTRGTSVDDAKVVFEGEVTDLTVSSYIDDQRFRGGGIHEIRTRALSSTSSKYWVRKVKYFHLLAENDPHRDGLGEPSGFKYIDAPNDAEIDFVGNLLLITLRSEWIPEDGKRFLPGTILYVNAHKFIKYGPRDRIYHTLFRPGERLSCENYTVTKQFIILSLVENCKTRLEFYKLEKDGNKFRLVGTERTSQIRTLNIRAVDPELGDEFWMTTSGYTEPTTLWLCDAMNMDTQEKKLVRKTGPEGYIKRKLNAMPDKFDHSDLVVEQNTCKSKDGTNIPYFLVRKSSLPTDKPTPTLLYGYGGFEVTVGPHYAAATGIAWLERGGVYVEANVRGGGEFGPTWHKAATRENRHKSLEDFIAVAEDLISRKICKSKTLAIRGGAIGGLLVANAYLTRPDLFAAVHSAVPILDLKRYREMGGDSTWIEDFGDPYTTDWEEFMKKFSPYHNIDESIKKLPPILLTANSQDSRVHPGHARKMTKILWEKGLGKKWPTYYYENTEGGAMNAKQHAFVTALAFEFLYRIIAKHIDKT